MALQAGSLGLLLVLACLQVSHIVNVSCIYSHISNHHMHIFFIYLNSLHDNDAVM